MKKKKAISENYLERIPKRNESIDWKTDENNFVILEVENKGIFNRIAQKLFSKPRISYIHLDENGSFLWQHLDGEKSIFDLGALVKDEFGEKAEPLYERLCKYFQILESYAFISL